MYSPENYHNSDNGFESDLCIQVFYFCLGRIDEILSEVFAACSKDLKAGTEEYWGSVTAAVAVTYSGMTKLQQDLGHGDLKTFYGVEESHELVAHLQYQIQTSTERLLLLLREQGLGCDNQWHEYFEDVSQLRGASNYPTVIMTLKNRQTSEAYDGSNSVLNNITVGWEPHAEGALLPDLESNLDASMNTPGSSTHSDGPQNAINLQSPYPISNMLSTNTRSYDSPVQQDNGTNSFSGTSLGSYRGIAAECASSSQQNQSYNSQYIWPYIQSEASPNIQYPNLNNWNNSSHYESIDMGQPAPGGFSLDLNTPPRPEELSSMMSSSADPITNPAYSQQSLGTMPYFSGHPHELSPGWPFYF
ncbi:hypothetical protein IFR05_014639 [Cadophora sp. M221]|nr:hypothetical protein IFR05_014639 [Cadophora sp. M221]